MRKRITVNYRRILAVAAILPVLLTPVAAGTQGNGNPNPGVLPINSHAYGNTYAEWTVKWWQWVLGINASHFPIGDLTGEDCAINQSGQVWFLAGTAGGPAQRNCTVPVGTAIFFPIVNVVNDYPCPDPTFLPAHGQTLQDFLTNGNPPIPGARQIVDAVTELEVEVDYAPLRSLFGYRATSPLFNFTADHSLVGGFDPCITGTLQQGVSDGYWIMLTPFSPGKHTIHFRGKQGEPFPFQAEVTYTLTVKP